MIVDGFEMTERVIARFRAKVSQGGPADCWPWLGAPDRTGYGRLHVGGVGGRHLRAHRIALALHDGTDIGSGVEACHRCDNPICVNPLHLFRGSHTENMRDRDEKGRVRSGDEHGSHTKPERRPRGERHGAAVLTAAQVVEIRQQYEPRRMSYGKLARTYQVSVGAIRDIVTRRRWAHL